jgi:hypothetical protein
MPAKLFHLISGHLRETGAQLAHDPEHGRAQALQHCARYRSNGLHDSQQHAAGIVAAANNINRRLATLVDGLAAVTLTRDGVIGWGMAGASADSPSASMPAQGGLPAYRSPSDEAVAPLAVYVPVTRSRHTGMRWRRPDRYHFAARHSVVPLTAKELPQAMPAFPIGFTATGDAFTLVAVQGIAPHQNSLVAADGRWLADYLPAAYRIYPFMLADIDTGKQKLCVDERGGWVGEDVQGERFFEDDGNTSQALIEILNTLAHLHADRAATKHMCAVLQQHRLIQPWPIAVRAENRERSITGLFRIDETALNALPPQALAELRDAGALALAYCQLLSMQQLRKLGQRVRAA